MRFDLPTSWRHGRGLAAQTGSVLRELGCSRALLVTDRELVDRGIAAPVTASLDTHAIEYAVCDEVATEPTVVLFESLAANWDLSEFDSVLAVGGGSVIDAAKGLAVVAQFGGHIRDYAGFDTVPAPLTRKIVAVPTTAGTGSEISDGSVWIDEARHTKFLVLSTRICPTVAITDPQITRSMPPRITANSASTPSPTRSSRTCRWTLATSPVRPCARHGGCGAAYYRCRQAPSPRSGTARILRQWDSPSSPTW